MSGGPIVVYAADEVRVLLIIPVDMAIVSGTGDTASVYLQSLDNARTLRDEISAFIAANGGEEPK